MQVTRKAGKIEVLRQAVEGLNGSQGRVGWFPSAKYEDGTPVAGVAAVHEFGTTVSEEDDTFIIPPRLGMRTTAAEKKEEWRNIARQISKAVVQGKMQPGQVMEAVGLAAEGHIREAITKVNSPPLSPNTIKARMRRLANGGKGAQASIGKPLVDTGILLNTLTSEVEKK